MTIQMRDARFLRLTAMLIAVLFAGTACTTNPYTGERQVAKGTIGAVLGAGIGAAVGAATGDNGRERKKRALIGAGVGAIAGGGVGVYMDIQEKKLRERLQNSGVSVQRVGDDIVLVMPGNITFETNRSDLRPQFYEVLNSVGLVLTEYDKTIVEVSGHTDSSGAEDYNQALSARRAEAVAGYLNGQGIARERFLALAFGETRPVAPNNTDAGRQQNRRVELTLVPLVEG